MRVIHRKVPTDELKAGNVHIRNYHPALWKNWRAMKTLKWFAACYHAVLSYFACDKEPFTDVRVRRAINHAINKDEIVNYLLRGVGQPAYGYLPPALKSEYYDGSKTDSYGYDVEKAKALLKEAGYENGLQLTLSAENTSEFKKLAEVLQSQLKEVGIETTIQLYDSSSYTDMLKEGAS